LVAIVFYIIIEEAVHYYEKNLSFIIIFLSSVQKTGKKLIYFFTKNSCTR